MGKKRLRKRELVRQCVPSPVRVKEKEQGKRALPGTQLEDRNDRRTMLKDITTQLCAAKRERRRGQQGHSRSPWSGNLASFGYKGIDVSNLNGFSQLHPNELLLESSYPAWETPLTSRS